MSQFQPRHGMSETRIHYCWMAMRSRCERPTNHAYANYGGRGIKVCERWQTFENFLADMGPMPDSMELDRINVNGDYEPGNCRWATPRDQSRNKRNNLLIEYDGRTQCLTAWAEELGIAKCTLYRRIVLKKMPVDDAFSTPVMSARESAKLGGNTRWGNV